MPVLTAPSLLDALRTETRALHEALERDSPMARLVAPDLTRGEYAHVLGRMLGVYAPLEARLAPFAGALPLPLPDRSARLRRDLAALGQALLPEASLLDAPAPDVPAISSAEAAWGVAYVLEGAALGGQVITRAVEASLGLDPAHGLTFFSSEGAPAGPRWRTFRRAFEAHPPVAAATDSARATFQMLYQWLTLP